MGKIFIVNAEWKADSKVYIVDAEWKADSKEFVVDAEWKSNEKVFIVDAEWKADRKIFLADAEWKAKNGARSGSGHSSASSASAKGNSKSSRTDYIKTLLSRSAAFEASNSNSSNASSSSNSSGCGGTLLKWFIVLAIIGGVLKYFGLTDQILNDTTPTEYKVIADSLNLRSAPDPNSTVVSIIPRDSILLQLKDSSQEIGANTWVYVTNKMDSGWVNEKYVERN